MNWIKIDPENLPEGEVLAGNFKSGAYGYREKLIGFLSKQGLNVSCESEDTVLHLVTHYIDINSYDPE